MEITRHVCSIIDQLRTKRTAEGRRRLAHRTLAHIGKPSYGENLITRTRPLTYIQTPGAGSWVLTHPRTVDHPAVMLKRWSPGTGEVSCPRTSPEGNYNKLADLPGWHFTSSAPSGLCRTLPSGGPRRSPLSNARLKYDQNATEDEPSHNSGRSISSHCNESTCGQTNSCHRDTNQQRE